MDSSKKEAEIISGILFDEYGSIGVIPQCPPPIQEGEEAIQWLKKRGLPYGEFEWAGYFIKFKTLELLKLSLPGKFEYFNPQPKKYLVKGIYYWDIKIKVTSSKTDSLILWDKEIVDEFLEKFGGLGLILIVAYAEDDIDGEFLRSHEKRKSGTRYQSKERIKIGKTTRTQKNDFFIIYLNSFYFTKEDFQAGINEGWVTPSLQVREGNFDGKKRKQKYIIETDRILKKHGYLYTQNFNYDPNDFQIDLREDEDQLNI